MSDEYSVMVIRNLGKKDHYGSCFCVHEIACTISYQNEYGHTIGAKEKIAIDGIFVIPNDKKIKRIIFEWKTSSPKIYPNIKKEGVKESHGSGVKEEDIPAECLEGNHLGTRQRAMRILKSGKRHACCTECFPYTEHTGLWTNDVFDLKGF